MNSNNNSKATILIVDDEATNIKILAHLLQDNYQILIANNGKKCLELLANNSDISMILLDIMMPDMDGYEVIKYLKASKKSAHIPVIFVTEKNNTIDETLGFSLGAADYITKPISPAIVFARIKTHLTLYRQSLTLKEKNTDLKKEVKNLEKKLILKIVFSYDLLYHKSFKASFMSEFAIQAPLLHVIFERSSWDIVLILCESFLKKEINVVTDICAESTLSDSTARRVIKKLVSVGVAHRFGDKTDKRRHFIELTHPYQRVLNDYIKQCTDDFKDICSLNH